MKVRNLLDQLDRDTDAPLFIILPSGELVPAHFHVTEIGRVQKEFIDCGGTRRDAVSCLLQVWTADDTDHRLTSGKLAKILKYAGPLLRSEELPVEIEYGMDVASQYFLSNVEVTPKGLLFILTGKQTDCLAPDKCGISGCC